MCIDTLVKDLLQLLLINMEVDFWLQDIIWICSVYESKILWNNLVKDQTSQCTLNESCMLLAIWSRNSTNNFDLLM